MDLKKVGQQYERQELKRETLKDSPIEQLEEWMQLAITAKIPYANAANLATVDANGYPKSRIILIKEIKDSSLVFFTNYNSAKAQDIERNNKVSLNIYWKELDRQVRVTGKAHKVPTEESREYFYSRPRESQISAIASNQSHIVDKSELYDKVQELELLYKDKPVEFPNFWGGFSIDVESIEFWQGRPNRLHDRFLYSKSGQNWSIDRLAP
ncbi:MAG: pyridoxamine 5'-phosphate oxidase [Bacteriovoracaceae bacterium]|nr:pyridoxamine 5'-phosphate oxidase [Bacteriovoracaceae bacterium]